MGDTEISWTHRPGTRGRTWNVAQGCSRVSTGCSRCYAERMAARFAEKGWSRGLINLKTRKWNGEVRMAEHKLSEPLQWGAPSTVFVNSMSDLFHEGFTNEQIAAVFAVMAARPMHTFQILTKRAKRMREWFAWLEEAIEAPAQEWSGRDCAVTIHEARAEERSAFLIEHAAMMLYDGSEESLEKWTNRLTDLHRDAWATTGDDGGTEWSMPWPLPNVWKGVSVENQPAADDRIPELLQTPAAVRFLSCEPLLGPLEFSDASRRSDAVRVLGQRALAGIHWLIAGCESGHGARPCDVAWLRSLRDQCAAAEVPFFLKQAVGTETGRCGDADNPNGDRSCGEQIRWFVNGPNDSSASCACTVEGAEDANWHPTIGVGDGSHRKGGAVIELPYLDGVQHAAFPEAPR